ncbi:MAG TPA: hypothetical protein VHM91_22565 [Verrucomicrobiales bacterium]|jgi:hypothetical protein|nr:hypothetical protein [Verrucomicrobiales bacterium]
MPAIAGAALCLSSCEVAGPGYVASTGVVSTDFALSYGNGYGGMGYYYGPPGLAYYDRGPNISFYRTRYLVPQTHWSHWHGDRRYYYGPGRDRDHDGIPNRFDRHPGRRY